MTDLLTQNNYTWPSRYDRPFDHQRATAEFMISNPRSFCFNDIGTAKTLTSLWATDFLMNCGALKKVLIVAPLSTLWKVWEDEVYFHLTHRSTAVLYGSKARRLRELARPVDYYIINHEGVDVIRPELAARSDIGLVIVDEGALIRNARTMKWRNLWHLCGPKTSRGLWWMTGSPMPKAPTDIWAQARIVDPGLVSTYFTKFRDDMMFKQGQFKWVPRPGWERACFAMLQPSIRYTRDECLDLPDCLVLPRKVTMSAEQQRVYAQMFQTFVAELKDGSITAVNEAAKRTKLLQIASGAVYDGQDMAHPVDCGPKLDLLLNMIAEAGSKAIVFVSFRHSLPVLHKRMVKEGLTVGVVYGDVSPTARTNIFRAFQDGSLQVLLAHPGTMSHGLTLTAAHTIIWWSPVDRYDTYEQANGRISRPGQTKKQTIVHLSCSRIEDEVYKRLRCKEQMQGLLLDLLKGGNNGDRDDSEGIRQYPRCSE